MKRGPVVAAAVFVGAIQLQKEDEGHKCEQLPCTVEVVATIPEQPHSLEEPPAYELMADMVEVATSPPIYLKRGSMELQEALKQLEEANRLHLA